MQWTKLTSHRLCWRIGQKPSTLYTKSNFTSRLLPSSKHASKFPSHFSRRHYKIPLMTFEYIEVEHRLDEHIGSCLSTDTIEPAGSTDTSFGVCFLGTGGSKPTQQRMSSSTVLSLGGLSYVFDAAEGVQRQLEISRVRLQTISKIFITHMHADHVFGLPSLLMIMQVSQRCRSDSFPIDVYGPPGLFNYISMNMKLTKSAFLGQQITVHELVGPEACRVQPKQSRNPQNFLYAEFSHKFLQRNRIPRNKDGTWTISNPEKITEENIRAGRASNTHSAGRIKKLFISAAEVKHLPHVPTFGYVVREQDPPLKIDVEKATALGVKPSEKYRLLQQGFPVQSDDGTTEVLPSEVAASSSDRARKFVLIGDNCETPEPMRRIMQDADVMVHEAALHHKVQSDQERGHSSAEMAGAVAKSTRAKVLVLNHFSNRVQDIEDVQGEVERAESTNGETSVVVPAHDFMEIRVPREGFDTTTISASSDGKSE